MNRLLLLSLSLGCIPALPKADSGTSTCHSLEFDGSTDYVEITNSESLDLSNDDFTIEMWVWVSPELSVESGAGHILTRTDSWNYFWLGYEQAPGGFAPRVWLSESKDHFMTWTSETVIAHQNWTHLALEREDSVIRILIDGRNPRLIGGSGKGEPQADSFNLDINGPMVISRDPDNAGKNGLRAWPGRVHGLQIVPRAMYGGNEFTPEFPLLQEDDALVFLPFSEGTGDLLEDSTGNENHGQIIGASWVEVQASACGES